MMVLGVRKQNVMLRARAAKSDPLGVGGSVGKKEMSQFNNNTVNDLRVKTRR
jgi:hypothetical protein